jgi:acyl-CoA thioesterase-1
MVNISEPEGTVFDTLLSSIMKKFLLCVILSGACALASCRSTAPTEPTSAATTSAAPRKSLPKIIAFGDSLTAGYGLDISQSYPSVLQKRLDADGYHYEVVNAGVSGDTSAGGVRRIGWAMEGDVKLVILELGANDILRFQPVAEMKKNLSQIIERAKSKGARVLLAGMEAPTNAGPDYRREARQAFIDLAREHAVALIPFFLEGVGGVERLNQPDGIHPNEEGTKIVVENVYKHLRPMLEKQ